jgi:NADH dehydrogenase (ubiquinone) 1 alpha subcomplex subunit 9
MQSINVGQALEEMLYQEWTAGQTFELHGPKEYQMAEIAALVDKEIHTKRRHINLPKPLLKAATGIISKYLWWPIMTPDEVEREFIDQKIDRKAKKFKDLGIEPDDLKDFTYHYLLGFRSWAYYDLPPATEKERREDRKFLHVIDDQ